LRPQVYRLGGDARQRIIVVADFARLAARHVAGDGDLAAAVEDRRIVEPIAAGEKTPLRMVALEPRTAALVEVATEDLETRDAGFRLDREDRAAPADARAFGRARRRRAGDEVTLQGLRNSGAAA